MINKYQSNRNLIGMIQLDEIGRLLPPGLRRDHGWFRHSPELGEGIPGPDQRTRSSQL